MSLGRLIALTLVVCGLLAAPAPAAQVNHSPGSTDVGFTAGGGEANRLTVTRTATAFVFTDAGAALTPVPGSDCVQVDPATVSCPSAGVSFVQIELGDLDDELTLGDTPATLVFGREGADTLSGGSGPDGFVGGPGVDTLFGNAGDDALSDFDSISPAGATERSTMDGGEGNDAVTGADGPDLLTGGPGADTVAGANGDDEVAGGTGEDLLGGGAGDDTLRGEDGNDRLGTDERSGAAGIPTERGNDVLDGGPGDDELRGGLGPTSDAPDGDRLIGGPGRDVASYSRRSDAVDVSLDTTANDGAANEGDDVTADVEGVLGGSGNDVLTGGPAGDALDGGPGSDVISGGSGDDALDGGTGDAGDDELRGGDGTDGLSGNAGNDRLQGGDGGDIVAGGADTDTLEGDAGNDVVTGGAGTDAINGGSGDDRIDGAAPTLFVEDARDVLAGDAGRDALAGGGGEDRLVGGEGVDDMSGGEGADTVDYGVAAVGVTVTLDGRANDGGPRESDNVATDVENVDGGGLGDTVTGSAAVNVLDASSGQDYLDGAAGRDQLLAGRGIDVVRARDNGTADVVDCGSGGGADFAILDPTDRARNCERSDAGRRTAPRLARRVVIRPARGDNGFGPPGMRRTVPLQDRIAVPVASTVDATDGRVRLTSARGRRGRQSATFYDGAFKVLQRRRRGLTELRLVGGDFSACRASASQGRKGKKRRVRRLWGSGRGNYRSRGRWSSAAARGTIWLVEDRCDGTLTRVRKGSVEVFDLVRKRTVIVRAGGSYLARAPR